MHGFVGKRLSWNTHGLHSACVHRSVCVADLSADLKESGGSITKCNKCGLQGIRLQAVYTSMTSSWNVRNTL